MAQHRPHTSAPADGSRTITLRDSQPRPEDDASPGLSAGEPTTVGALRLRGAQRRTRQSVAWGEDVVDNEGCGKKKSKICCIYHKPRRFDESSSEESESGSDADSDDSCGHGSDRARPPNWHAHGHRHGHGAVRREGKGGPVHELHDSGSDVNAYERAPKRTS
ncbi:phosphatase inhibitor-domain-containing protein [Melanogaster broomeanus]|nr:phosphatase inhibitor-domain-containing protein [Melanogaster broomeanus]